MENRYKKFFCDNIFLLILLPLVIISGVFSYYRFMINHDYKVGYEGVCDPFLKECFIGCEDAQCTTVYYYTKVIKYAPDLFKECGKDITDCEDASVCLPNDRDCSIVYCDVKINGDACETLTEESNIQYNNSDSVEEKNIINNINNTNI